MRARAIALAAVAVAVPHKAEARCVTHDCWHRVHVKRQHHWIRRHYWRWARAHLSSATKGWLFTLRMCESTDNYRAVNGSHTGAYQYDPPTWHEAGGSGIAMWASPAEQDVRTARFDSSFVAMGVPGVNARATNGLASTRVGGSTVGPRSCESGKAPSCSARAVVWFGRLCLGARGGADA